PTTTMYPGGADDDPNYGSDGYVDPLLESDGGVVIEMIDQYDDGFDVKVTLTNNDDEDEQRCVAGIWFDKFTFNISPSTHVGSYYSMRFGGKKVTGDGVNADGFENAWYYPEQIYCPAQVLEVNGYTVGLSVQYPILEYQ